MLNLFNITRPRQHGRHFADVTFKCIFLNENVRISIKIWLKCVRKGPINNITALVQIMAWRRPGNKPLSEPMLVRLLMHICITRSQLVKETSKYSYIFCHLHCTGSWNPPLWKTRSGLSYLVNTVVADDWVTPGARASVDSKGILPTPLLSLQEVCISWTRSYQTVFE